MCVAWRGRLWVRAVGPVLGPEQELELEQESVLEPVLELEQALEPEQAPVPEGELAESPVARVESPVTQAQAPELV